MGWELFCGFLHRLSISCRQSCECSQDVAGGAGLSDAFGFYHAGFTARRAARPDFMGNTAVEQADRSLAKPVSIPGAQISLRCSRLRG